MIGILYYNDTNARERECFPRTDRGRGVGRRRERKKEEEKKGYIANPRNRRSNVTDRDDIPADSG